MRFLNFLFDTSANLNAKCDSFFFFFYQMQCMFKSVTCLKIDFMHFLSREKDVIFFREFFKLINKKIAKTRLFVPRTKSEISSFHPYTRFRMREHDVNVNLRRWPIKNSYLKN